MAEARTDGAARGEPCLHELSRVTEVDKMSRKKTKGQTQEKVAYNLKTEVKYKYIYNRNAKSGALLNNGSNESTEEKSMAKG